MTPKQEAALRQAREALESCTPGDYSTGHVISPNYDEAGVEAAIAAIDEALAEQPAQPSKPLTDEQILHRVNTHVGGVNPGNLDNSDWIQFARAIEAAHSITGETK